MKLIDSEITEMLIETKLWLTNIGSLPKYTFDIKVERPLNDILIYSNIISSMDNEQT